MIRYHSHGMICPSKQKQHLLTLMLDYNKSSKLIRFSTSLQRYCPMTTRGPSHHIEECIKRT